MSARILARAAGLILLLGAAPGSPVAAQQSGRLAGIDVFGTRAFTAAQVRAEFGTDLDSIAEAFGTGRIDDAVIARYLRVVNGLRSRGDFAYLDLAVINYFDRDRPTTYITVDAVERADSARRMPFRPPPTDTVTDPDGIVNQFASYLGRGMALLQQGLLREPEPPCPVLHCVPGFHHDSLRAHTEHWVSAAPRHFATAMRVLHGDASPERRAAAAFLLGYTNDAQAAADALASAVDDPASEVRNNALRVLIMLAQRQPPVAIPVAPVVAALHFPAATDRNKAAYVLLGLADRAENRPAILRGAGAVLLDMLELEQPNNRGPAHDVLRRISGQEWGAHDVAAWRAWWQRAPQE